MNAEELNWKMRRWLDLNPVDEYTFMEILEIARQRQLAGDMGMRFYEELSLALDECLADGSDGGIDECRARCL